MQVNQQIHAELEIYRPPLLMVAFCDCDCMDTRLRHSSLNLKQCIGFIKLPQSRVEQSVNGSIPPIEASQRKLRRDYRACLFAHFDQADIKYATDAVTKSSRYETLDQTWVTVMRTFVIKVKGVKQEPWYQTRNRGPMTRLRRQGERDGVRL